MNGEGEHRTILKAILSRSDPLSIHGEGAGGEVASPAAPHSTRTGSVFQISRAYSRIVRSDEKRPMRATLRIAMAVQRSGSRHASSTATWQSTYAR